MFLYSCIKAFYLRIVLEANSSILNSTLVTRKYRLDSKLLVSGNIVIFKNECVLSKKMCCL